MLPATIYSQVTIGAGIEPEQGALLDLKTLSVPDANPSGITTDNNGGGLLLPRVKLTSKNELFFIENSSPEIDKEKLRHTGLVVFNLSTTVANLKSGVCIWDGQEWKNITDAGLPPQEVWALPGNTGTNSSRHFIGTKDNKSLSIKTNNQERIYISEDGKVGIGTTDPKANLHVLGEMVLRDAPIINGAQVLGINNNTFALGKVPLPIVVPKYLFAQDKEMQYINSTNALNLGNDIVVTWDSPQMITINSVDNKQLIKTGTGHTFIFLQDATCEVKGYVNYVPIGSPVPPQSADVQSSLVALVLAIQYQPKNSSTWSDITESMNIWEWSAVRDICESVITPSIVKKFSEGDKVRMVIRRPMNANNKPMGIAHNDPTTDPYVSRIGTPTGSSFSKGLKILELLNVK